jgi:hypothetical protein
MMLRLMNERLNALIVIVSSEGGEDSIGRGDGCYSE